MAKQIDVAVVGGGVAGLAAAHALLQRSRETGGDVRITVYEASGRTGGKIFTRREAGLALELGADSMLARKRTALDLCEDLGLAGELVGTGPLARRTYIVGNGVLHPFPTGTYMGIPVTRSAIESCELLSDDGKRRALQDFSMPDGSPPDGADESLGGALRRRLGDEMVDRIADAVLSGIYGGQLDDMSLLAALPEFRQAEREHGSVLHGFSQRLSGAGTQARGPVPKSGGGSMFVTLGAGLDTLVERLVETLERASVTIVRDTAAILLRSDSGGSHVLSLRGRDGGRDVVREVAYDGVIIATPAYDAAEILRDWPSLSAILADIPYTSVASLTFVCQEADVGRELDGAGFVVPRAEARALTACTWVSVKWPHARVDRELVLRCFLGRAGDSEGLSQRSDGELAADAVRDMASLLGYTGPQAPRAMARWDQAMPQYRVGHLARMDELDGLIAAELPHVGLAGAAYRGVGISDAIASAQAAARKVWAALAE